MACRRRVSHLHFRLLEAVSRHVDRPLHDFRRRYSQGPGMAGPTHKCTKYSLRVAYMRA